MVQSLAFQTIPLQIVGGSYQSRSLPISAQRTVNFYPQRDAGGLSEFNLYPWPGLKLFSSGTGVDRGMTVFNDTVYRVGGRTLYEVNSAGTQTSKGTIGAGSSTTSPVGFSTEGDNLLIADETSLKKFNGTTLASNGSGPGNENAITFLNNQFIVDSDDGAFYVSDAGATTFTLTNSATPESDPDSLTAPYAYNQILYLFGHKTIEPWENTGVGSPPFERIDGGIIEGVGTLSRAGITDTPLGVYFLSQTGRPYRLSGFQVTPIGKPAVVKEFADLDLDTVRAYSLEFDDQFFVVFAFSTATWVYTEALDEWFELDDQGSKYRGSSYVFAYNKHLVADHSNGDVYELDFDTYTNNSNPIWRERTMAVLAGETGGKPRLRSEMSKIRFSLETGAGLTTGQGENPKLIVQLSKDGGHTFGQEHWLDTGTLGEFTEDVELHEMTQFKQLVIKMRMTDPVSWTLYAASIDVREAGY